MKKKTYFILLAVFLIVFAVSAYKIGNYYWNKHKSDQAIQKAAGYVKIEETNNEPKLIDVDFKALQEINSDIIAWIYCPDTQISYPVVQGTDNAYYLSHLLDNSYNVNGTVFMDYRGTPDFSAPNNILYGHHMKSGAMFAPLMQYKEQDYYDKHPCMYLFTPKQNYRLELFAGVVVESDDAIYGNDISTEALAQYLSQSTFTAKEDIKADCPVVTLSTCSYEFENARYVVLANLIPITE